MIAVGEADTLPIEPETLTETVVQPMDWLGVYRDRPLKRRRTGRWTELDINEIVAAYTGGPQ